MANDKMYCPACGVESAIEKARDGQEERILCSVCGLVLEVGKARPYEPIGDIIFADDSDLLRVAIEDMLLEKKLAGRVVPAADGQAFLEVFTRRVREGNPADLVMLDVQMPIMDGFHAALAMRGIEAGLGIDSTPLVFFSSQPCDERAQQVLRRCGRAIYVNKVASPNLAELASRVEQVLINLVSKGLH